MKHACDRKPESRTSSLGSAIRRANRYLMQGVGLAALAATATTAVAQDEIEEVVVEGIRASVLAAAELKRNSNQFVDAIVAEDIGKLPDANIAEALQRVTGVQISRKNSEGAFVALRGLDQRFTQVTVNGQTIAPFESNEGISGDGVNLTPLSSSIASRIEVFKSPTAKLNETGIGGTVNVVKRRALEIGERVLNFTVEGSREDRSDDIEPKASIFYSDTFLMIALVSLLMSNARSALLMSCVQVLQGTVIRHHFWYLMKMECQYLMRIKSK